jgi:hypothetical protein
VRTRQFYCNQPDAAIGLKRFCAFSKRLMANERDASSNIRDGFTLTCTQSRVSRS